MKNYSKNNRVNRMETHEEISNELIIGRNPVIEALKADKLIDLIFVNSEAGGSISLICKLAKDRNIPIKQVNEQKLNNMSNGASHQGVIAMGACAEYVTVEDILEISQTKGTDPFIIICDEVEDPHNLGAIIRSADAFGAHGVIISKRRAVGLTAAVEKASGGALNHVAVAKVPNLAAAVDLLKENGLWIYGSDMIADKCYFEEEFTCPLALIVGSEGNGIGNLLKKKCDILLKIPMKGKVSCLNASVAAGVIMQEISKYR